MCNKKMKSFSFCVFILLFCVPDSCNATEYRQERSVIKYYNPKYVSQAHTFTGRRVRSGVYTTNTTFTNIHDWNNNVTFQIVYKIMQSDLDFSWSMSLCDILKQNWITEYARNYSDIPLKCPLLKGDHHFFNMVFPPKNFPLPVPKGNTNLDMITIRTNTQEKLIHFSVRLLKEK